MDQKVRDQLLEDTDKELKEREAEYRRKLDEFRINNRILINDISKLNASRDYILSLKVGAIDPIEKGLEGAQ